MAHAAKYGHKHAYCRKSVDAFRVEDIYSGEGLREGAFQWHTTLEGTITGLVTRCGSSAGGVAQRQI